MSCRVDTSPLIASACVVSLYDGHGITGAAMRAATGTGASGAGVLYNDWDAGDDAKEFRALIVAPPAAGTFTVNEDGSFSLVGAPDGSYSYVYRLFLDGVDQGTATASMTIGAGASFSVTGVGQASTLAFGAATAAFESLFTITAAGQASTLAFGTATVTMDGMFLLAADGQPSSLAFGTATITWDGVFIPEASHPRRLVITSDPRLQGTTLPGSGGAFIQPFPFSPGSHLDIEWDWRRWLNAGDSVDSFTVSWEGAEIGAFSGEALGDDVVRAWLTVPDEAIEGARSSALCTVTTTAGRVDNREFELLVKQL